MAIEVRIEPRTKGGMRLITDLPAVRPCRLEGKNGIGKSAMIRLLMLLSGEQPYKGQPQLWKSLKDLVGPSTVTLTGLTGAYETARIVLTPELWLEDVTQPVGDWVGTLELDGSPAPASELFGYLDVIHVVGTERLGDTLELQYSRLGSDLRSTLARLGQMEDQRAELGDIADDLEQVSPRRADQDRAELVAARAERSHCVTLEEGLAPRVADLLQATGLRVLLDNGDAAEQEQRLKDLREQLQVAKEKLSVNELAHSAAIAALNRGSQAERDVAKAERALRALSQKLDALAFRQALLVSQLDAAGIDSNVETLDSADAEKLDAATANALRAQRAAQLAAAQLSRSEAENDVIDEMRVVLDSAVERGLSELRIATFQGSDITVADFRSALGQVTVVAAVDFDELTKANATVSDLKEIAEIFDSRAKLFSQAEKARSNLEDLEGALSGRDDLRDQAKQARARLDESSTQVRALNMEIGAMTRSALGGADVADAEALVAELLARHGVDPSELSAQLAESQASLEATHRRVDALKATEARLNDQAARRRVTREQVRARAFRDSEYRWLADLAEVLSREDATDANDLSARPEGEWPDTTWQALADHVAAVRSAMNQLVDQVGGLESVSRDRGTAGLYRPALRSVIEQDALEQLSIPPIVEALFNGGEILRVNLDDGTVTWRTRDGEVRTRPLDAFSSGEQALGFIRARLEQVAATPAENRLIFLDEFGAFIAADGRRPLAELLTNNDLLGLADQVVVVLPLQADYGAELDQTTGPLHETYERRAGAVASAGYFTEVFDR